MIGIKFLIKNEYDIILNKIFHDLIVKFPTKPIVVFSPPRGTNAKGVGTKLESGYLDAIQKCSAKWCLPFFDDYNSSGFKFAFIYFSQETCCK